MRKIHSKTVHQNIELIPYDSASCHIYTHISQLLNELHLIIPIVYKTLIKERSVRRPSKHYIRFLIVVHYAAKFRHLSRLPQRATPWSHRRGCTSWPFARDRCDLSDTRGTEAHCPASTSFPYRVNAPSTIQLHTATEFAAVGQKHSQIEEKDGNDYQRLIVVQYGRWE